MKNKLQIICVLTIVSLFSFVTIQTKAFTFNEENVYNLPWSETQNYIIGKTLQGATIAIVSNYEFVSDFTEKNNTFRTYDTVGENATIYKYIYDTTNGWTSNSYTVGGYSIYDVSEYHTNQDIYGTHTFTIAPLLKSAAELLAEATSGATVSLWAMIQQQYGLILAVGLIVLSMLLGVRLVPRLLKSLAR